MSVQRVAKAIATLREATAQAAWVQWSAIFTVAASRRPARSIVDPEALLLVSIALRDHEPRLWSAAVVWAQFGAHLLSVQRAKNLSRLFPPATQERLGEFARLATQDGGDLRWRSLVQRGAGQETTRGRPREGAPRIEGGAALMLRLRLGLGVGIKPDVLAHLIGHAGGAMPVILIAKATSYYGRAVRRALEDLAAADFVEARPTAPISYRTDTRKWAALLAIDPSDPPAWRSWAQVYAFVAALDQWSRALPSDSRFVLASEARDLVDAHGRALDPVIRLPQLDKYRGEAYLEPFVEALEACVEFVEGVV
jgi:hypothetical protein